MPHFLWEKNIITRRVQGCLVWSGFGSDVGVVLVLLSGLGWRCPVVRDAVHILQSTCHARSALAIVTLTKTRKKFRALGTHFSLDYCCSSLPTWNEFNELKTSYRMKQLFSVCSLSVSCVSLAISWFSPVFSCVHIVISCVSLTKIQLSSQLSK